MKATKLDGGSLNQQEALLALLRQHAPEIFSENKIDVKQLRATLGEEVLADAERYGLNWAGKMDCFRTIQETTTNTLKPVRAESVNFDSTENLFIEGDNLEVLKVLQKSYYGKVKMIYIDPPYNTGNDFIYNDKFSRNKREYLEEVGAIDKEGNVVNAGLYTQNTKDSGHFHSDWLNMMYPRLFLAKNLLRQDGVIFVSIDDNESFNLRVVMNEIFGEQNFVSEIVWEKRFTRSNNAKKFATLTERIMLFRKSDTVENLQEPRSEKADSTYSNPDNDSRGEWTSVSYVNPATKEQRPNLCYEIVNPLSGEVIVHPTNAWKYSKSVHQQHVAENRLYWGVHGENKYPRLKRFLSEMDGGMVPVDLWNHETTGTTDQASKELAELMEAKVFDFPKPIGLIQRMLKIATESSTNDIILDFFAGSGTTAQAVMQLNLEDGGNRKCISVQLPEKCKPETEAAKAGFVTIADITKERIRRTGKMLREESSDKKIDEGFKVFKLDESNFKIWNTHVTSVEQLEQQMIEMFDNVQPGATKEAVMYELILKSGKELNVTIEEKEAGGEKYFKLNDGSLVICLADKLSKELFTGMLVEKPKKIIVLDKSFGNDDQLKTNLLLQAEGAGVDEVRVI